jgi:hypothetical protein
LQFVAQGAVVTAFQPAFFPLAFPGLDQMFQAPGPLDRLFAALRASFVSLHAELIFPLPGDRQIRELIFDPFSHFAFFATMFYSAPKLTLSFLDRGYAKLFAHIYAYPQSSNS